MNNSPCLSVAVVLIVVGNTGNLRYLTDNTQLSRVISHFFQLINPGVGHKFPVCTRCFFLVYFFFFATKGVQSQPPALLSLLFLPSFAQQSFFTEITEISIIKRQHNNALNQAVSHRYKRSILYDVTSLSLCLKNRIPQVREQGRQR